MRPFVPADLPALHAMTQAFGWPHRPEDLRAHAEAGEGVVIEDGGTVAGTAFCWRFGSAAATLGLVCVRPDRQGRGIGRRLMQAALDHAGSRAVQLFATPAGAPLYRSLSFTDAGLVWQRQGTPGPLPRPAPPFGFELRSLVPGDRDAVLRLDRAGCGMERPVLLDAIRAGSVGAVLVRGGTVGGFAFRRAFGRGEVIGPVTLSAELGDPASAGRALVLHLMEGRTTPFIRLDVTEHSGLSPWLGQLGLDQAYEAFRMVRGDGLGPNGRSFALVSQALG